MVLRNISKINSVSPSKKELEDLNQARASGICSEEESEEIQKILNG